MRLPTKGQLAELWSREFVREGMCGLCGQVGVIDTRGVRSTTGIEVGDRFYCICPNGRHLKRSMERGTK